MVTHPAHRRYGEWKALYPRWLRPPRRGCNRSPCAAPVRPGDRAIRWATIHVSGTNVTLFNRLFRFMSRVRTYHTPCLPSLPPSPSLPSSPRLVHICVAFYLAFILPLSFYQPTHTLSSFFPLTQAPFPSLSHTLPSHLGVPLDVPLGVLPLHVSGTSRAAFR